MGIITTTGELSLPSERRNHDIPSVEGIGRGEGRRRHLGTRWLRSPPRARTHPPCGSTVLPDVPSGDGPHLRRLERHLEGHRPDRDASGPRFPLRADHDDQWEEREPELWERVEAEAENRTAALAAADDD